MAVRVLRPRCPCRAPASVSPMRHYPLSGRAVVGGAYCAPTGVQAPRAGGRRAPSAFFSAPALSCAQPARRFPLGAVARGLPAFRSARMPANRRPFLSATALCYTAVWIKITLAAVCERGPSAPLALPRVFFMVMFWLRQLPPQSAILPPRLWLFVGKKSLFR